MIWRAVHARRLLSGLVLLCALGCQSANVCPLGLCGAERRPLSVALVTDPAAEDAQVRDLFPSYQAFQQALSKELRRPVAVDVCFPFQAQAGFCSGWYDLAVITAPQLAELEKRDQLRVLAVGVDRHGQTLHDAVLIVNAASCFRAISDLRNQNVALGPAGDTLTHHAALPLLRDAGLNTAHASQDVPPPPGSIRHLPDGRAIVQAVLSGQSAAGFVDDATWDALPRYDPRPGEPARDKFRVIGRTAALPTHLLVACPRLDQATLNRVRAFVLTVGRKHPQVVEPLTLSGYRAPTEEMLAACRGLPPSAPTGTRPTTQLADGG